MTLHRHRSNHPGRLHGICRRLSACISMFQKAYVCNNSNKAIVDSRQQTSTRCAADDVYLLTFIAEQKFGRDRCSSFGCYALAAREAPYTAHCVKTWCHPQNRKYLTYHNAVRWGPSHGHFNMHKIWLILPPCGFRVSLCELTDKHTHNDTLHRPRRSKKN